MCHLHSFVGRPTSSLRYGGYTFCLFSSGWVSPAFWRLLEPLRVTLVEHEPEDTGILEAWGRWAQTSACGTLWATQLVTGMIGIAVVCTEPFPYLLYPFFYFPFLCLFSCLFVDASLSWLVLGEDPAQMIKCSSSRRIEPFIAT